MTKKEQFMAFVLVGATARDIHAETNDAQLIVNLAGRIPGEAIPVNVINAAKVYLAYFGDLEKRPYRWMLAPPGGVVFGGCANRRISPASQRTASDGKVDPAAR